MRKVRYPTDGKYTYLPVGPLIFGAWHVHHCPGCDRLTTGTGKTYCPECAAVREQEMTEETNG